MRFKPILLVLYGVFLALGLGAPAVAILQRQPFGWLDVLVIAVSSISLITAAFVISLFLGRMIFPEYWSTDLIIVRSIATPTLLMYSSFDKSRIML